MNYLFPLAFTMNSLTMTAFMVILGFSGKLHLAAEVGIIHGALTALFFSFSANSRSLILNQSSSVSADSIFYFRILLMLPLAVSAYFLSALPMEATAILVVTLTLRRCMEWMAEIQLSEMEVSNNQAFARKFVWLQTATFIFAIFWLFGGFPLPFLGLFVWALSPVSLSGRFIVEKISRPLTLDPSWRLMLPQLGSTVIIGVSLYVFRLVLLLMTGKDTAGILFTAFALGGIVGSVFAQVVGPSAVLYEQRNTTSFFSPTVKLALFLTAVTGGILLVLSQRDPRFLSFLKESSFFWGAIGASMIGGVIMVFAQHIRFRILQRRGDNNVFGADLLMNLAMIASAPVLFFIVGVNALMFLFALNALLALVFYWSAEREDVGQNSDRLLSLGAFSWLSIAFLILFPLFFQLGSGIFYNPSLREFDSLGLLSRLPIPLSLPVCFIAIILLGGYRKTHISLCFIFFTFILMLIAAFVSSGHDDAVMKDKLMNIMQFVMPAAGLVLGQRYGRRNESLFLMCLAFLVVLATIVPIQLVSTWFHEYRRLSPNIFFFTIYQHVQYVPTIFVSAYLLVLFTLWRRPRYWMVLAMLVPFMGWYSAVARSLSAFLLFSIGTFGFLAWYFLWHQKRKFLPIFFTILLLVTIGYLWDLNPHSRRGATISDVQLYKMSSRLPYWEYHLQKSLSGHKEFIFGNRERPDRKEMASSHNYYIDILYHSGFISLLPIFGLIGITTIGLFRHRRRIMASPELFGLSVVVLFHLFVENVFKVGLRQPYPGIFTFFLWGLLLSQLSKLNLEMGDENPVAENSGRQAHHDV